RSSRRETAMKPAALFALFLAILTAPLALAQPPAEIAGDWKGTLNAGAVKLRLAFHIGETTTFDSLDQGAHGMPATSALADGKLQISITGIASFEGALSADGKTAVGVFKQGGAELPLTLERGSFEAAQRPQTPK